MARKATILKTIGICANAIGDVGNNNPNPLKKRERTDDGGDLGGSDPPSSRGVWGRLLGLLGVELLRSLLARLCFGHLVPKT